MLLPFFETQLGFLPGDFFWSQLPSPSSNPSIIQPSQDRPKILDLMGFNRDLLGFNWDLMGFNWDLMGSNWELGSNGI